jgi:hypothetical protein
VSKEIIMGTHSGGREGVPMAHLARSTAAAIIASCRRHFPSFYNDCSGFAKAVAHDCGVILVGQANDIVDYLQSVPTRVADGREAARLAKLGKLVIGGVKASGHGHVVVVVDGPTSDDGRYPYAYWGAMRTLNIGTFRANVGKLGYGHNTVNYAYNQQDLGSISYAYFEPLTLLLKPAEPGDALIL